MKSKVTVCRPHLNSTGQQNTWSGFNDKLNYDWWIEFSDGTVGINSCQTQGQNPHYLVGNDCEYETKPGGLKQDGTPWPQKIIKPKSYESKGGSSKGGNEWKSKPHIETALDKAFYIWASHIAAGKEFDSSKAFKLMHRIVVELDSVVAPVVQPPMSTVATAQPEAKPFEPQLDRTAQDSADSEIDDLPF